MSGSPARDTGRVERLLEDAAARWPDGLAVVDAAGAMTFAALQAAVEELAAALVTEGVGPGQGLALVAGNGRAFVIGLFAGLRAGATVMPASPQLAAAELRAMLDAAGVHAVLDDRVVLPLGPAPATLVAHGSSFGFRRWTADPDVPMVGHVPDAAFVRYTSGTTGTAKGVVLGHASVRARTAAAQEALGLGPSDRVVWVLPMAWHFVVSIVTYVRAGAAIVVCGDMLSRVVIEACTAHGGTVLYAAPTHYRMLAADASGQGMPGLRLAVSTSSGIPEGVARAFEARFGLPVSQVYGIIEVGLPVGNLVDGHLHPDAIGRALPGYEVALLDEAGVEVDEGAVGHLAMRGPGMFDGYLDPPRRRDEVLEHGWFLTGDLARRDADGLVVIAGRRKSMINTAGLKVFPEEVEAVLDAHPSVRASRVCGEQHPVLGEIVVAQVVPEGEAPGVEALRRHCREQLSAYKIPQRITFVDALPRTRSGKVVRHEGT
ncbi:MAG: AMP-binding protein [Alphaproteobacteria bacterium]|nr:AMP-binding protein [Alphaproteobacteria bacterium]